MVTLININRIRPLIAPVALDYLGGALRQAGVEVELLDLALCSDPDQTLQQYFQQRQPQLVGITFRNVDDCFWPSGTSFLPQLSRTVQLVRQWTDAPLVLGGVGFSVFARAIVAFTGAEFGIRGDGERSLVSLVEQLRGRQRWDRVEGLIYRQDDTLRSNPPAWPTPLKVPAARELVDHAAYFRQGGQIGLETKRGCGRRCIYCADPLAKGRAYRLRDPAEVAEEAEALVAQGVDVLHLCDAEFNLPRHHAEAVCRELVRRRLGNRLQWYTYMAVTPLDAELLRWMRRAGCVGIDFTSDAAHPRMLATYGHRHRAEDLARAVQLCRGEGIRVMLDMLLGGPGETPETVAETIRRFKQIDPHCAGAAVGVRIYPHTPMAAIVAAEGPVEENPNIRRHYRGPLDLLQPTFYVSAALGPHPARLVRELIGDDERFFPPEDEHAGQTAPQPRDHNYNDNRALVEAITAGARGAYWDILRRLRPR